MERELSGRAVPGCSAISDDINIPASVCGNVCAVIIITSPIKGVRIVEEFVILFVSNNFRMKGLVFLMKALAGLKRKVSRPLSPLDPGKGPARALSPPRKPDRAIGRDDLCRFHGRPGKILWGSGSPGPPFLLRCLFADRPRGPRQRAARHYDLRPMVRAGFSIRARKAMSSPIQETNRTSRRRFPGFWHRIEEHRPPGLRGPWPSIIRRRGTGGR